MLVSLPETLTEALECAECTLQNAENGLQQVLKIITEGARVAADSKVTLCSLQSTIPTKTAKD